MTVKLTMDKTGRVVLPKPLRDELQLEPGDTLEAESSGEQITLRPVRPAMPLQRERGVWVFKTGERLDTSAIDDTVWKVRDERHRSVLGEE